VNPWDVGSARLLAGFGFQALATSSAASASVLGRRDHALTRGEALAHATLIVNATELPVSADLGDGFGASPETRELAASGVKRISLATSLYRAAMTGLVNALREISELGEFSFVDRAVTTADLNALMHL